MGINLIKGAKVIVMVASVERALRFYTRALGLALRYRRGDEYAEVEAPGLTLALLASERSTHPGPAPTPVHCSIGFDVERLEGAMLVLRERGVQFAPEIAEGDRERIAYFADEDGTPLFLREEKPQPEGRA
jgi:catechol 2,3-dioxygenase-like lactoylglutathione lyase family enzyme